MIIFLLFLLKKILSVVSYDEYDCLFDSRILGDKMIALISP